MILRRLKLIIYILGIFLSINFSLNCMEETTSTQKSNRKGDEPNVPPNVNDRGVGRGDRGIGRGDRVVGRGDRGVGRGYDYHREATKELAQEEELTGYSREEIKKDSALLTAIAKIITNNKEVILEAQNTTREKHGQAAYELWRRYNDHNIFPSLDDLYREMNSVDGFSIVMKSKIFDVKKDSILRKRLRTFVGRKSFTLFSEDIIEDLRVLIPEAASSPTKINLILRPHGKEINPEEDAIELVYTFTRPIGFLYEKEDTKSEHITFTKENEPKSEMVIGIDAKPYIDALMRDRNALNGEHFLGGSILSVQGQ